MVVEGRLNLKMLSQQPARALVSAAATCLKGLLGGVAIGDAKLRTSASRDATESLRLNIGLNTTK